MPALGNVISGKGGKVKVDGSEVANITKWDLDLKNTNHAYGSSATGDGTGRVAGRSDFSGTFELQLTTAGSIPVVRGGYYTLQLHIDGSGSNYYSCPAIVDSIKPVVDIETGKDIRAVVAFSANGDYTKNGTI